MTYKLFISPKAESQIIDAQHYYEMQQSSLGEKFLQVVEICLERIRKNPFLYPAPRGKFREAFIRMFPFILIYYVNKKKKEIIVYQVFHTSQDPEKKP